MPLILILANCPSIMTRGGQSSPPTATASQEWGAGEAPLLPPAALRYHIWPLVTPPPQELAVAQCGGWQCCLHPPCLSFLMTLAAAMPCWDHPPFSPPKQIHRQTNPFIYIDWGRPLKRFSKLVFI